MGRFQNSIDADEAYALSLIACDRVITEQSGSRTIVGTFDVITPARYPAQVPRITIYACIARGASDTNDFYLIMAPEGKFMMQGVMQVSEWNEWGIAEFEMPLYGIVFPSAGNYLVRLFAENRVLLERSIVLRTPPAQPEAQADSPTPAPSP
jgi:hypothetical protein